MSNPSLENRGDLLGFCVVFIKYCHCDFFFL
jgi:hypothetical protein